MASSAASSELQTVEFVYTCALVWKIRRHRIDRTLQFVGWNYDEALEKRLFVKSELRFRKYDDDVIVSFAELFLIRKGLK